MCMIIKHTTMDTWKEFEANELTPSAAHHLLAIPFPGIIGTTRWLPNTHR